MSNKCHRRSIATVYREDQLSERVIDALRHASCFRHKAETIEVIESDLAWVVLTGPYAYKNQKTARFILP